MSPDFPSPGAFPDTVFASVLFGANAAALEPESFAYDDFIGLFDYDAVNGFLPGSVLTGASVTASAVRAGWMHFDGAFDALPGLPAFAVTFENLDGNGTPRDSAFLVDNLEVGFTAVVPDSGATILMLAMASLLLVFSGARLRAA
jgi:hypothetical protein